MQNIAAVAIVFKSIATISAENTNYDGGIVIVSGCTLTVNGPHTFESLFVTNNGLVTHSPAPNGEAMNKLQLTISSNVVVATGSKIDVNYLGYGSDKGPGAGVSGAGGGHGGSGGGNGSVYGSITQPALSAVVAGMPAPMAALEAEPYSLRLVDAYMWMVQLPLTVAVTPSP